MPMARQPILDLDLSIPTVNLARGRLPDCQTLVLFGMA
jgi:hypothetical protein